MDGVADEILKLRFTCGPIQSLYLNEDRVSERFTSHLGAITTWTRTAEREGGGSVDLKLVKGDVREHATNAITYTIADPLVRALLVREALQASGVVHSSESATVGQYVLVSGRACLRRPEAEKLFPLDWQVHADCLPVTDPRYAELEMDRARAEVFRLALAGPASVPDRMWLLTLSDRDDIKAASVLNSRWIDDAVVSYLHTSWEMFGTLRESASGVPLLAAIHVWASMPANVMCVDTG